MDIYENPFFKKMDAEPGFKENFISDALVLINNELEKHYQKDLESGAKAIKFY